MALITYTNAGWDYMKRAAALLPLLSLGIGSSCLLRGDSYTFSLIPDDGNISGAPGDTIGWGYSITNDSTTDWLLATNLNADSFAYGTPTLLFDFPEVAPGATVTELFDPIGMTGLYEDVLNASAPNGAVDSGEFDLSAQWYNGDPFNGGTYIADAVDTDASYSATVTSANAVPEPSTFALMGTEITLVIGWWVFRRRRLRATVGRIFALVISMVLLGSAIASAQEDPLAAKREKLDDPGITHQQADDILKELREIRQLLEKQARPSGQFQPQPMHEVPQTGTLKLDGGFSLGSSDAPITIVEFTDYQCPFCRQFESTTLAELRKRYVDTGAVRFVVRDFPLVAAHPDAMRAAEAARCAADQDRFWPMHDLLFGDPTKLSPADLLDSAKSLKLDADAFGSCLKSGKHALEIQNDLQVASALQINGTPAFVIGKAKADELSGSIVIGAQPLSVFEAKLKEAETAR